MAEECHAINNKPLYKYKIRNKYLGVLFCRKLAKHPKIGVP